MSGKPSPSSSISSTVPCGNGSRSRIVVGDLCMALALISDPDLDNRLLLSLCRLAWLFLLCPASSHPLLPKLPRQMSDRVGAFEATSPVADHMPEGRLDSMNFGDAPRMRPDAPDVPRARPSRDGEDGEDGGGEVFEALGVAMML